MPSRHTAKTLDAVWAYLCGLTSRYGMDVTYEQAKRYSKKERMRVDPDQVMQILQNFAGLRF